ncbi:hypothetical protein TCAL_07292 [Tigriopus californicus]|uniref:Uncharacterized protein n=1 Tax=Tigriopus californicus TaxID=6832 RepID=A0A553NDX6_TIGCA|nr:mucolipin-3-like [Tigriopus californicus]XP_059093218.1 mucolipin-3-like [Tigriopus californicus]TRY63631.1 hypothetical protein TCAL_07292 [Tigriopus californicus]|eukprot:TCALIF_07292-PA protein Name:"Similar to MCOLN2 Mucolipin-2 (Homo sapiens)" AED:0.02 eAED:0.02 QI:903/1/1/1/1/1/3/79/662
MQPGAMSTLRPRSPAHSRRTSVADHSENGGQEAQIGPRSRQRHFSGLDGNAPRLSDENSELGEQALLHRSGSWGGVNESEEDLRHLNLPGGFRVNGHGPNVEANGGLSGGGGSGVDREERFRRHLAFFFMDPVQKFQARRQIPWKLTIQFLKILVVTVQVVIFGNFRYAHTKYYTDNQISLENLFLQGWDSVREIHAYPPATGTYAVYKKETFYSYMDYIGRTFHDLDDITVNPVFTREPFMFCYNVFGEGLVFPNLTWNIDFDNLKPQERCLTIPKNDLQDFNSTEYLTKHDFLIPWDTIKWMRVNFSLATLTYSQLGPLLGPECFAFHTDITFDNSDFDGQIPVALDIRPFREQCPHPIEITTNKAIVIQILNYVVISLCVVSLILCMRALWRAQRLRADSEKFFLSRFGWVLTSSEKLEFLNVWYIVICFNDVFIIVGSAIKETIETRSTYGDLWDYGSLFLGIGVLLVWIGMLRYLGFFKTYNVLILTLKGALPNVLRFLLCASLIYMGFVLCGWVVLAPYHFKFKSILTTSECLFSLINGDDMFATFSSVPEKRHMVWTFLRIYLYLFISLFIYVILSLFIAIIMDTYDIIKEYYKEGWPKRRLHDFYQQARYNPAPEIFRRDEPDFARQIIQRLVPSSLQRQTNPVSSDTQPIILT